MDPDGEVDRVVEMPVSNLTNCTFGGAGGNILYATSAAAEPGRWERFAGCLFAVETNVMGVPATAFEIG
jgi:sugar lactone lactonase YvrE